MFPYSKRGPNRLVTLSPLTLDPCKQFPHVETDALFFFFKFPYLKEAQELYKGKRQIYL